MTVSRLLRLAVGAALAWVLPRSVLFVPPGSVEHWVRHNYRGRPVSLRGGPAVLAGALVGADLPGLVAGLGAAALGRHDDRAGNDPGRGGPKGLAGHLAAVRAGRLTTGAVKLVGLPLVGLLAAGCRGRRAPVDLAVDAALIATCANLLNLLDLRPGRALKVAGVLACGAGQPGTTVAAVAAAGEDLGERTMLGDCGANGLGALLGAGLVRRLGPRRQRAVALAGLATLTLASERVSFSAVIDRTPPLRWLDRLGRAG